MNEDEIIAAALVIAQRRAAGVPTITVKELYKPYAVAKGGRRSWKIIEGKLRPILEAFGDRDAMSLRVSDTEDYRASRRLIEFPGGKGRTYSDLSINFELQWLKAILIWATRGGRIPHNPLASMKDAKCKKTRKTSPTEDEITLLLDAADTLMRAIVLLASDSGLRRDEARCLRWDWIDEPNRVINLPAWATKSQKDRTVPVTARTFEALKLMPRHLRSPFVFINPRSKLERPYDGATIDRWFKDIVDEAGIQAARGDGRVHIHDLRHSYARRAARAGVRVEIISLILGHATLQQTMVYLQTGDEDVIDALDTFEDGLRKSARRAPRNQDVGEGRISIPKEKST